MPYITHRDCENREIRVWIPYDGAPLGVRHKQTVAVPERGVRHLPTSVYHLPTGRHVDLYEGDKRKLRTLVRILLSPVSAIAYGPIDWTSSNLSYYPTVRDSVQRTVESLGFSLSGGDYP